MYPGYGADLAAVAAPDPDVGGRRVGVRGAAQRHGVAALPQRRGGGRGDRGVGGNCSRMGSG